jgi:hypothetical protein
VFWFLGVRLPPSPRARCESVGPLIMLHCFSIWNYPPLPNFPSSTPSPFNIHSLPFLQTIKYSYYLSLSLSLSYVSLSFLLSGYSYTTFFKEKNCKKIPFFKGTVRRDTVGQKYHSIVVSLRMFRRFLFNVIVKF